MATKKKANKKTTNELVVSMVISQPLKRDKDGNVVVDEDSPNFFNGVLTKGEICIDLSTNVVKVGDGVKCWKDADILDTVINKEEDNNNESSV